MIRVAPKANPRGGAPRQTPLSPLGKRIDELADKRSLSIGQVAELAGISRQSLGAIRSGKTASPSMETIFSIAKALGVTVDGLYAGLNLPSGRGPGRPRTIPASPFGIRVQERLDAMGMTRVELAERASMDGVTLWRWMRGRHRIPVDGLIRVSKALRCKPGDLMATR